MLEETEFEAAVTELTEALREDVLTRHLGALKERVELPLEMMLIGFATSHVLGVFAASHHLKDVADVPAPDVTAEEICSAELSFAWAPTLSKVLLESLERSGAVEPVVLREMEAGLAAASDRLSALAFHGARYLPAEDATVLPRLFDMIASAYMTGVALGREAAGEPPTEAVLRVLAAIRALPTHERRLLVARYAERASVETMGRTRKWNVQRAHDEIADALDKVEQTARRGTSAASIPS